MGFTLEEMSRQFAQGVESVRADAETMRLFQIGLDGLSEKLRRASVSVDDLGLWSADDSSNGRLKCSWHDFNEFGEPVEKFVEWLSSPVGRALSEDYGELWTSARSGSLQAQMQISQRFYPRSLRSAEAELRECAKDARRVFDFKSFRKTLWLRLRDPQDYLGKSYWMSRLGSMDKPVKVKTRELVRYVRNDIMNEFLSNLNRAIGHLVEFEAYIIQKNVAYGFNPILWDIKRSPQWTADLYRLVLEE